MDHIVLLRLVNYRQLFRSLAKTKPKNCHSSDFIDQVDCTFWCIFHQTEKIWMTRIISAACHSRLSAPSVPTGMVFARFSSTSSSHSNGPSPSPSSDAPWHALIRTHHITSRKKIARLRHAASEHGVFAMLRSGGAPGIMYVVGKERESVEGWVASVQVSSFLFTFLMTNVIGDNLLITPS